MSIQEGQKCESNMRRLIPRPMGMCKKREDKLDYKIVPK